MNGPLGYSAETSSLNCTLLSLIVTQPIFKKFVKSMCVICILDSTKRVALCLHSAWYILWIGWVQRVYEQVPAFSPDFLGFVHTTKKGNIGGNLWFVHNHQFYTKKAQN